MWGSYPALLHGPQGAKVEGAAFEVQSEEQVKLSKDYETKRYRVCGCQIKLEGGMVSGRTFVWHSKTENDLRDGTFNPAVFQAAA